MKKSSKSSTLTLALLLGVCSLCACGAQTVLGVNTKPYIISAPAHISEDTYPGYTRVYVDVNKDLAIYYDNEYRPDMPDLGNHIESEDGRIHGQIVDVDDSSIYILLDEDSQIMKGDSGTAMYFDDQYVGFISSVSLDNKVRVVCY